MLSVVPVVALALARAGAPSLMRPDRCATQHVSCAGRQVGLRVPDDDLIMQTIIARAHEAAAASEDYDAVMEERCSELLAERPAYWAQVWPSAVAAGSRLLREPSMVEGKRVLELGAGLGLVSTCAALAGAQAVVATDREVDAVTFAAANAAENGVGDIVCAQVLDWSSSPAATATEGDDTMYDVVLGSDIVYDESAPVLLARLLHDKVAPGGLCFLTDNADRPYEETRRAALLKRLVDQGDFHSLPTARTSISLDTRQGDAFVIVECVLRRRTHA